MRFSDMSGYDEDLDDSETKGKAPNGTMKLDYINNVFSDPEKNADSDKKDPEVKDFAVFEQNVNEVVKDNSLV